MSKVNDENELKGLQVKAELDKLGAAPRSYSEYLSLDPSAPVESAADAMEDCATLGAGKRPSITDRFAKIERARPAVHPVTIQLARRLKNMQEDKQTVQTK